MAASNKAKRTNYTLNDLRVYDLDPQASEIWACVGPDGADPRTLDPDNLPEGFRLITEDEWDHAQDYHDEAEIVLYSQAEHWRESHYIGNLIHSALLAAGATGEQVHCDFSADSFDDLLDDLQCDVLNFLVDRGYSARFFIGGRQRHGVGVIVHRYRPEQQPIIEKTLEAAVAASKPAYEERAAELVEALRREAEEKRDEQRIALFDEAVDLLRGAKEFLSAAVPYRTEIGSKLCDFLAKVAKD